MQQFGIFYAPYNRLSGIVPSSLSQWSNLQWFEVSDNQLSVTIPTVLGPKWSRLETAFFDSNVFTGAVHSSFCSKATLITLEADCLSEVTCATDCCTSCS